MYENTLSLWYTKNNIKNKVPATNRVTDTGDTKIIDEIKRNK